MSSIRGRVRFAYFFAFGGTKTTDAGAAAHSAKNGPDILIAADHESGDVASLGASMTSSRRII